jgi:Ser-tRNA(Ala) deacylase AlaX
MFWENPYQTHLETEVTSACDEIITLKETIFYALAGGQESDRGSIGGCPVIEAHKSGREIFYSLPEDHALSVGDRVTVEIDWDRRYKLMRLHFAAELILELITRNLAGSLKIGAHISAEKARIDFEWPQSISGILPEIKAQAQKIIDANSRIVSAYSDQKAERRYWQVEGFARVGCGGTHLKHTGEVGELKLKRKNIGKGKERVEIYLAKPQSRLSESEVSVL